MRYGAFNSIQPHTLPAAGQCIVPLHVLRRVWPLCHASFGGRILMSWERVCMHRKRAALSFVWGRHWLVPCRAAMLPTLQTFVWCWKDALAVPRWSGTAEGSTHCICAWRFLQAPSSNHHHWKHYHVSSAWADTVLRVAVCGSTRLRQLQSLHVQAGLASALLCVVLPPCDWCALPIVCVLFVSACLPVL
jgi:hypothetical protein